MIYLRGMHGLGDCIHERAIVRQLMQRDVVYLETSWPSVFHDLMGQRLQLIAKASGLRTQQKNAQREAGAFSPRPAVPGDARQIWYTPEQIRRFGSVLAAMCDSTGCDSNLADFRLPIPSCWADKADALIARWQPTKPILLYRPLIQRTEWSGCSARNPDFTAYAALGASIRDRFFVVSVADLVPNIEWMVGTPLKPDVELHAGELDFPTLAALAQRAALVFCSPGFAVILAQAVGTPSVCVFGGYENSSSFSAGMRFAPYLGIDPANPCQCFKHDHACDKRINLARAVPRLQAFVDINCRGEQVARAADD